MRALVKQTAGPGLDLVDVAMPEPGPGEVRIRIRKVSICGTDMHIWKWDAWAEATIPVPMVVGHEYAGVIDAVGAGVTGLEPGQRVSGEGHIPCGSCRNCQTGRAHICARTRSIGVNVPGAFADYLVLPAANVRPLPDFVSDDIASILDPLGNAVHTALAFDLTGEDVLITGAGPIGCMAAAVCRHVGARRIVVTDLNDDRLALASRMGASRTVRADREDLRDVMTEIGMREGFDVGLEMSGAAPALDALIEAMITGGNIALLGLFGKRPEVDLNKAIFKGLSMKGIYGRRMFETWHKMYGMLESGLDVAPVISHTLPFERFADGFEAIGSGAANKVVLDLTA
ncbi:L-threonine 3-dehydrogenase [Oceanomicrobium pacificus]|uniref:L-threonine 3-dehydrogenase n=1 Tax=Oceanomicrobium pacificus TaxID=2692916 RepID=A0A6B0TSC6_9RHOB|nr:L-threonine 3-dehydrogenase [Oceanomicrobium pacificus]MXU63913.1 L-threonine 3-dehydrogenase [Oceanomicrobium pacificus]